jgi:hypothetical protein
MSEQSFKSPSKAAALYDDITSTYQEAFAVPPWNEVTKCPDTEQRCESGFSPLKIGAQCDECGLCMRSAAYETQELVAKFEAVAATRPTSWYLETNPEGVVLAALAWQTTAATLAAEQYPQNKDMEQWLDGAFSDSSFVWLSEVFANRNRRPSGNLANFGGIVRGFASELGSQTVAYRTIEPRMIYAAMRDFGDQACVFAREDSVPDRRDFVIINIEE